MAAEGRRVAVRGEDAVRERRGRLAEVRDVERELVRLVGRRVLDKDPVGPYAVQAG